MQVEYFKEYSANLGRDMEFKVYGHGGKPAVFFPSQDGRFYQYEDFGMIQACEAFIDEGRLQIFCVDSVDAISWSAGGKPPRERILCHEQYIQYILNEFIPLLQGIKKIQSGEKENRQILFAGVSMGAAHAANCFFRFPCLADSLIALSGMYSAQPFLGDYMDKDVYRNSVADYLSDLADGDRILEYYRNSRIVICSGQGAYEDLMVNETRKLQKILTAKNIPAWVDFWGGDVSHDWEWWLKQMPYFLNHVL